MMGAWRKRHLRIADMLASHLRAELIGDELVIFRRPEAPRNGHVDLDKVVKIAEHKPVTYLVERACGKVHAIASCQREQRPWPNRAFEMYMQLNFWDSHEIAFYRHPCLQHLSSPV